MPKAHHRPAQADVAAIERAMVRIRRSQASRSLGRKATAQGQPVRLSEAEVLDAVEAGPADGGDVVTVGDVATRLGIDASRASRRVAAAISAGGLRRVVSQRDARRVGLELTTSGVRVLESVRASRQRIFEQAIEGWSASDRRAFAVLLARFVDDFTRLTRARR